MPNSRTLVALLERVSDLARLQFRTEAHVVAVPSLGSPLDAEHFALLEDLDADEELDADDVKALVDLSKLVDCIQDGGHHFRGPEQSPGFLSEAFRDILRDVAFAPAPIDQELAQRYAHALSVLFVDAPFVKTDAYASFSAHRTDVEQKELSLVELRRRAATASTDAERSLLAEQIAALETLIAESRDVVQALDREHAFSAAEQTRDAVETTVARIPDSVASSLATFALLQITDPESNESHVRCSFMPAELSDDNWVPLKLTRKEIEAAISDGGFAAIVNSSPIGLLNDEAVTSVELDVQLLAVQRPWFWGGLFENRGWNWRTPRAEPVSQGIEGGAGLIPAYVTGIIVGRNLVVKGSGSRPVAVAAAVVRPATRVVRPPQRRPVVRPASHMRPAHASVRRPVVTRIRRTTTVKGVVTDERGQPVAGATAMLRQESGHNGGAPRDHRGQRTTTGRGGTFEFEVSAGASCVLSVVMRGFTTWRRQLRPVHPVTVPVTLRSERSTWPQLTVRIQSLPDGEPFVGRSDVRISNVRGETQHSEQMSGVGEITVGLPNGHYRIDMDAPEARQVTPAVRTIELSSPAIVEFMVDSGILLRQPELHLVGFICKRVPKSPNPSENKEGV